MAETKTFNTRVQLKYDTLVNWQNSVFNGNDSTKYLKVGELAIVTLAPNKETNATQAAGQHPLLFKVGTGSHRFDDLPWLSGLAADVYDWAKKATPDWSDFPALPLEVVDNGTGKFITDFIYDNNKLTITRANVAWSDIADRPSIPTMPTVNDGTLTLKASNGLTATQQTFSANNADNVTFEVKHGVKPTSGSEHATTAGSGRTYVTKVDVDSYGHIAKVYTATESDQDLSGYKTKQTAVSDPTASGKSLTFIDTISQNANGVITATKKNVNLDDYATKAEISTAMVFKGTLGTNGTKTSLPTASADTVGDTYKVITAGTYAGQSAKVGDTFVCSSDPTWVLIPSGDEPSGTVTNVATGDGLTGGPIASTGTISHAVPSGATAGSTSPSTAQDPGYGATFNIPVITTDKFGHVTAKSTTTVKMPSAQDLSGYKTKQTAVADHNLSGATVVKGIAQNANGVITVSTRNLTPADIGAQPAGNYATKEEMLNADAAILSEAQKYTNSAYSAAPNGGLVMNTNRQFAIDDSITFVFNCGSSTEVVE